MVGGEGDDRGWDGWMTSLTQWTQVWANSGSWWWTGKPGMLQSMGLQTVGYDWVTELNRTVSVVSPSICREVMRPHDMVLIFWMLNFKPTFSLSSSTFIKGLFSFSSLSAIRVESSAYLRLLIFLPVILIPACASSSLAFHMMYSAYKLNKQGDNIQLWCTPFPTWNQSVFPCPVLTVASWHFLLYLLSEERALKWYIRITVGRESGHSIFFVILEKCVHMCMAPLSNLLQPSEL